MLINNLMLLRALPAAYLGRITLYRLELYMIGYSMCLLDLKKKNGISEGISYFDFRNALDRYVQAYYGVEIDRIGWPKIITEKCNTDLEAFNKFFEIFDQFLATQNLE